MRRFCVLVAALLSGCAAPQPPSLWDAHQIGAFSAPALQLKRPDGQAAGIVSPDHVRRIMDAARRIESAAGVRAQMYIADGKEANAFAWRHGGTNNIALTLGMLELLKSDYDAYAAIIGHELAHLTLEHARARRDREEARSGASGVIGAILSAAGVPLGGTIADVTTTAVATVYSRDEEREADRHGIQYAHQAGFDPQGAVRAWEKMAAQSGFSIPFLSTHPVAQERLETMRELAAKRPPSR